MTKSKIYITSANRTATATLGKSLRNIPAEELGSSVIDAVLKNSKINK